MRVALLTGIALIGLATSGALAQQDIGQEEYMIACAGCHGESAKGDGPLAGLLDIDTPDLTNLTATKGDGEVPFLYTLWMIDGRNIIRAHGAAMPTWGDRYTAAAGRTEAASETPESRELVARGRILSLLYYLESIQE